MFKLTLYSNRKLILWLAIGLIILFIFTANTLPQHSLFFSGAVFVGGALISSAIFRDLHDEGTAIQYLTLPVSQLTKYLVAWVLTGPLYLLFVLIMYGIGVLIHVIDHSYWWASSMDFGLLTTTYQYLSFNAFLLLGSICFKKLPLIKTLLVMLVVFLAFTTTPLRHLNQSIIWWVLAVASLVGGYFALTRTELK